MIGRIDISNFTRFRNESLEFSPGLNVFLGANGTGKSHVMKLLYASIRSLMNPHPPKPIQQAPTKTLLETTVAERLIGVFVPDTLGRLATRCQGLNRAEISLYLGREQIPALAYSFSTRSTTAVQVNVCPTGWEETTSVFLPTREMLSLYPNFVSTYQSVQIPFEETWYDLAVLLGTPLPKGPHIKDVDKLLTPLEKALDGKVILENGRFYIKTGAGKMEAHLLAEGLRKIGTLAQLVANRCLTTHSVLFWDEPEANLNPLLIELAAETIMGLVKQGMQVFIASHSLFLMRQLYLLSQKEHKENRYKYFSLTPQEEDGTVHISTSASMDGLGEITFLERQNEQNTRLMELFGL